MIGNFIHKAIKLIYPQIEGGYVFGENPINPADGLIWENTELEKPTWEQIERKLADIDLENVKAIKKAQINALRDTRMAKDILGKVNGKDYYFQRNVTANLAWVNYLESSKDIVVTNWVTADNKIIDINQNDLVSICTHIRDRDTQAVIQARKCKDALEKLSTLAEVEAFDINQVFEI